MTSSSQLQPNPDESHDSVQGRKNLSRGGKRLAIALTLFASLLVLTQLGFWMLASSINAAAPAPPSALHPTSTHTDVADDFNTVDEKTLKKEVSGE